MADHPEITLGETTIACYPQRHAYLTNRIGKFVDQLAGGAAGIEGTADIVGLLGDSAYDVLCALIPNLSKRLPRYEFAGYGSQDAYDAKDYDPELDKSPTFPEIVEAFETAIAVNRFDVFKALKGLVDPKMLKADVSLWISEQISGSSPSSPGTSGESQPTSSGTTDRISDLFTTPAGSVKSSETSNGERLLSSV